MNKKIFLLSFLLTVPNIEASWWCCCTNDAVTKDTCLRDGENSVASMSEDVDPVPVLSDESKAAISKWLTDVATKQAVMVSLDAKRFSSAQRGSRQRNINNDNASH